MTTEEMEINKAHTLNYIQGILIKEGVGLLCIYTADGKNIVFA